ncbi:MAG: CehA/McbA family metallohydrolase [Planctomycetota bacterium]|nr:CehA/McbA family metallohydrolase [Planctomycetota bacterium]
MTRHSETVGSRRQPRGRFVRTASTLTFFLNLGLFLASAADVQGDDLPIVSNVEFQPLAAQVRRVVDALEQLGRPLDPATRAKLDQGLNADDPARGVKLIQQVLDPLCLIGVEINPESRVKAAFGPASPELVQNGRRVFLIKVHNEAGSTAELVCLSRNAKIPFVPGTNAPAAKSTISKAEVLDRWLEVTMIRDRPLRRTLSGLALEYRLIDLYSRDAGHREGKFEFNIGQGTQDLGFRAEVDILFNCLPATTIKLEVLDVDGKPTTASFLIRDQQGRVYPAQSRRLAPDFFFHPQIYRASGETVELPPGKFNVTVTRGPEYLAATRTIDVPSRPAGGVAAVQTERFQLKRWANLAEMGWFSGDHHVHAAGCAHYESPSEGVRPEDMMRHIVGEDLDVGCVLSWGPCWYVQKQFFDGRVSKLSTAANLMRYDVEVSGFPSSHAGHLCLLRLKEDDYPGAKRIEDWPSWDLPILKWGKSQGGVVGFSHSGWGLKIDDMKVLSYEVPPFDGIGANEYIVDVTHDAVDFISTVDTPAPWELNIWYHTLNCGYRTRISGETDFPCIYGDRVGLGRSYVKLDDGKLDFDRWVEGIKQGRSYVSDGKSHLVDFRVDTLDVGTKGSELVLAKPGKVHVTARVAARLEPRINEAVKLLRATPLDQRPFWDLERARLGETRQVPVEVIVNGQPVERTLIDADGTFRDLSWDVAIERSSWVALRIYLSSHTNPVFVTVAGKPIRASRRSADWCLEGVERCWTQKENAIRPDERPAAKAAYDHARAAYRKIQAEAADDRETASSK